MYRTEILKNGKWEANTYGVSAGTDPHPELTRRFGTPDYSPTLNEFNTEQEAKRMMGEIARIFDIPRSEIRIVEASTDEAIERRD